MWAESRPESGKAPAEPKGFPSRIRRALPGVAVGAAIALASGAALLTGAAGLSAAIDGQAIAGVVSERPGGVVLSVSPTGFAWRDGIRPGQIVTDVAIGETGSQWRLQTWDGRLARISTSASAGRALSGSLPAAALGFALGCLSILLRRSVPAWAVGASSLALLVSSGPLELQGAPVESTVSLAAAVLVPLVWLTSRVPAMTWARSAIVIGSVIALLAYWGFARLAGSEGYAPLEAVRADVASLSAVALLLDVAFLSRTWRISTRSAALRPRHLLQMAALAGLAFVPIRLGVSPIDVAWLAISLGTAFAAIMKFAGNRIEHTLLSDLLNRASIEASEKERARFASDLHDMPLQQLTGVIQRLDAIPGGRESSDELRALAEDLRGVAANQRPPVLDDLGLGSALEFVAEQLSTPEVPVRAEVIGNAEPGAARRPPSEVELAILRIVQEATANALRHSRATRVLITGEVAREKVAVSIADNGTGLTPDIARLAARQGRLGLVSMRWRARAIGARLSISASRNGTTIGILWP